MRYTAYSAYHLEDNVKIWGRKGTAGIGTKKAEMIGREPDKSWKNR